MKCKYCAKKILDSYADETCDSCWELKNRIESDYNNEAKKKILNELGWLHKDDSVKGLRMERECMMNIKESYELLDEIVASTEVEGEYKCPIWSICKKCFQLGKCEEKNKHWNDVFKKISQVSKLLKLLKGRAYEGENSRNNIRWYL